MPGFRQELVGVFGHPVDENPTQAMIEAAFEAAGLDCRYLTIDVEPEGLADAVRGARAMGFRGFNCTIPDKVAVVEHLDRLGRSAALMGAVNCVVRQGDELVGENTDGAGFLAASAGATRAGPVLSSLARAGRLGRSWSSSP
jgi:shikimate dehydrogenase